MEEQPPREPTPVPKASIYMQAIDWLIEVKAIPVSIQDQDLYAGDRLADKGRGHSCKNTRSMPISAYRT